MDKMLIEGSLKLTWNGRNFTDKNSNDKDPMIKSKKIQLQVVELLLI